MKRNAKDLQKKSKTHSVSPTYEPNIFYVDSSSGSRYTVSNWYGCWHCNCKWGTLAEHPGGSVACSHVGAVVAHLARQVGTVVSLWATDEDAKRQKQHRVNLGDGVVVTVKHSM